MKTNIVCTFALAILTFTGCVNINEDISLNNNGSGTYTQNIDMSSMAGMMSMLSGMDTGSGKDNMAQLMKMDKDTTIQFSSYTDTSTSLTAEQKQLFKDGSLTMSVHPKDNVMNMKLNFPFKKTQDLQQILNLMKQKNTMNMLMKQSGMDKGNEADNQEGSPDLFAAFHYTVSGNTIEMKADTSRMAAIKQDSAYSQMQMMQGMLSGYSYTTVIHFPKPVKKATGDNITLSADKKTATITAPMSTLMDSPAAFAYHIEY